ncbi:MAG: SDR family oxidoreductase [Anaerolineae bacterium]|nr:SDR family oxidoreductase [Anaerolineae bacterium]
MRLNHKVAFITGGGKGIGQAIARLFAAEGACVTILDVDAPALENTAAQIRANGGNCLTYQGSVTSSADIRDALAQTNEQFGGLDILVSNAGVAIPGSVVDISEEDWDRVFDINLKGAFRVSKYGIPYLLKRGGGAVINIASTQGWRGFPGWSGYAATKGAIIALSRQVAMEYSKQRVRCNSIAPGAIDTPMNEGVFAQAADPAAERRKWDENNPLGRIGQGDDIARAALYLASDDGEWVTGTCLIVDGGQLAGSG